MVVRPDELDFDVGCKSVEPFAKERRTVGRPREGRSTESFVCATCGKTVTIKVASRSWVTRMRIRMAVRVFTLLAFAVALFWTVGVRDLSAGEVVLLALGVLAVLAAGRHLAEVGAPDFHLALDADLQRELERTQFGAHVHVFSRPGRDAWR